MKKLTILTLTLLLTALAQLTAQLPQSDSPIVRLIYFRPSDKPIQPDINPLMDSVIKDVQRFYAAQMEQHGYGRKTFQFEADANGTAVVHHVNGRFNDAYYQDALLSKVAEEIRAQVPTERDIYLVALDSSQRQYCGVASGGMAFMRAPGDCVRPWVAAHELGHTFGLQHDARDSGHVMYFHQAAESFDAKSLSDCTAEWLDVHPAFNAGHSAVNNEPATIEMLAPSLTSPNTVRLRFEVTDPDGLHQAQLLIGKGRNTEATLTTCKQFNGNPSGSLEFVTTGFPPQGNANLLVIDMQGNTNSRYFPIDITPLLPPAQVVTIPDANLAVAIREALDLALGIPITTHAMLTLTGLDAYNREIKDITGLEHAHNLRYLNIGAPEVNGERVNSNVITDLSPLSDLTNLEVLILGKYYILNLDFLRELPPLAPVSIPDLNLAAAIREELVLTPNEPLTTHSILDLVGLEARNRGIKDLTGLEHAVNLTELHLGHNAVSDVSPLANLTQLTTLDLESTAVSDVSPLAGLTQLTRLNLLQTAVSDISPLANLPQLTSLNLSYTGVSDVSLLSALTQLTYLFLGGTAVSDVSPLSALTQLTYLFLGGTAVSDVSPLAGLTQLTRLELNSTAVSDVSPLAGLTQLTSLSLNRTGVSDVSPLAGLTQLTYLSLGGTGVSDVSPLAGLTQLTELSLWGNAVSDVSPLAGLTQLTRLYLDGTAVSDVSPLAGLTQLTWLNLTRTAVSDVSPLAGLTQLTRLYLYDTAVSDVSPLANLTQLQTLGFQGSPLSYASIHTHIPAMQAKGIEVAFDNVAHPALLKTSGDGQEGAGGEALPNPFVLAAMDEHGKPIVGKTVRFDILAGGGMLSAQTATTDAQGTARFTLTLGAAAGVNKVKATAQGIQSWVLFTAVGTESAPRLVGDVNEDGVVDLADLAIVAQAMGKPVENPRADVNADGVVDGEDFALVAANLGEGEAAAPSQAALPARFTRERVKWALNLLHAENTGSPAFRRGIAKLEGFLELLMPDKTLLLANYPNPFNPETWIPYQLANPAEVTVTIYAANGAVVRKLDLGHQRAGSYDSRGRAAYWDGRNEVGEPVASGVYFYTLQAGEFSATRKMVIQK